MKIMKNSMDYKITETFPGHYDFRMGNCGWYDVNPEMVHIIQEYEKRIGNALNHIKDHWLIYQSQYGEDSVFDITLISFLTGLPYDACLKMMEDEQ